MTYEAEKLAFVPRPNSKYSGVPTQGLNYGQRTDQLVGPTYAESGHAL